MDRWANVRRLAVAHSRMPFPDCRGEEVDGVDLVMVDADLHGCLSHLLDKSVRSDQRTLHVLRQVTADLDRILDDLPAEWSEYFSAADELAHAALDFLGRHADQ